MAARVLDSIWFHEMGSFNVIGIVKVDNGHEIKYYIGTAPGKDEEADQIKIMEGGAKFPKEVGDLLMWP